MVIFSHPRVFRAINAVPCSIEYINVGIFQLMRFVPSFATCIPLEFFFLFFCLFKLTGEVDGLKIPLYDIGGSRDDKEQLILL